MSDEKPKPFAEVVRRMRAAQRAYFKSRDRAALDESIRLEREVDAALDGAGEHQGGLFSSEPSAAVSAERRDAAAKALRDYADDVMKKFMPYPGYFASDFKSGAEDSCRKIANYLRARAAAVERGE